AYRGDAALVTELAEELGRSALPPESRGSALMAMARVARHLFQFGMRAVAEPLFERLAREVAEAESNPVGGGQIQAAVALRAFHDGDLPRCVASMAASVDSFARVDDLRNASLRRMHLSLWLLELGAHEEAEEAARGAIALSQRIGIRRVEAWSKYALVLALV